MISWKTKYNIENLKEACEIKGIAPSQIEFIEVAKVSLSSIELMWYGETIAEKEKKERGWASELSIQETQK